MLDASSISPHPGRPALALQVAGDALAWLLAQQPWIVPIPGTRKVAHLRENLGAAELILDDAALTAIADALSAVPIEGECYTEQMDRLTKG